MPAESAYNVLHPPGLPGNAIRGKPLADKLLAEVAERAQALTNAGWPPRLVSIAVGDTSAVEVYIRNQERVASRVGIGFEKRFFPDTVTQEELRAAIAGYNADPRVSGVIIQRPVPRGISVKRLQAAIHPLKDVEGMHPTSIGNIVYNELDLAPCTAAAAVELLRYTGLTLEGLEVTVIGHSEIVGKPIAFLLMAAGATVTVCHHMTRSVAMHSRRSDAVFVAVGRPELVTGQMIKPGAVVIDIGINETTDSAGNRKLVGDVDFTSCAEVAGWITPVPGGVGPVTVAILMRNTIHALERQKAFYEAALSDAGPAAHHA